MALAEGRQPLGRFCARTALGRDSLLDQLSEESRNAGVAASGFYARPPGDVFFQGHGYVPQAASGGHETSVTRDSCYGNPIRFLNCLYCLNQMDESSFGN